MVFQLVLASLISTAPPPPYYGGGDPSEIPEIQATGGVYRWQGKVIDPLVAIKKSGQTAVRLRIWVNPTAGYCDLSHTLAMAKRVKDAGLRLMLDFHYSDWWADPGHQPKPAAWANLNFADLTAKVHDYSRDVLSALYAQGTPPEVVQPGNEISNGMLWPDGQLTANNGGWNNLGALLRAGIQGIKDGSGAVKPKIMIHIDKGGDNGYSRYLMDNFKAQGVNYDIIGLSYYFWWQGHISAFEANVKDLATRYPQEIMVAETAYPFRIDVDPGTHAIGQGATPEPGYPFSQAGQLAYIQHINAVVRALPNGKGRGVLWWAPAWLNTPSDPHNYWENLSLFDYNGNSLPALSGFKPAAARP